MVWASVGGVVLVRGYLCGEGSVCTLLLGLTVCQVSGGGLFEHVYKGL